MYQFTDSVWEIEMVRNNFEKDIKIKYLESDMSQAMVAEKIGTSVQYVNRITNKKNGMLNKTFVEMMDAMGYDLEVTYIKKTD